MRAIIAHLTKYWNETLTKTQRVAWNLYATRTTIKNYHGKTIHLSGFNHFVRSNVTRVKSKLPVFDNPN